MASTIPALRGEFGSFEYWLTTMHVGELTRNITIPKDMPDWGSLTLEERYQRDLNLNRVKRDIAPYFANEEDRFTSALVLAVFNDEGMSFEPLQSLGGTQGMAPLYQSAADNIGFLTFSGGEVFIPLDGQHRAKALKYAVSGVDDSNKPIPNVAANMDLATDDVAVILVRFEKDKSRHIFNKINRYAKATQKGQNLITDDDDQIAVITRQMVGEEGVLPTRLVRVQSNTLSRVAPEFTTIATMYDANKAIAKMLFPEIKRPESATATEAKLIAEKATQIWELLLDEIELFAKAVADPSEAGDQTRRDIREDTLLGKPLGQLSLVRGGLEIANRHPDLSCSAICDRLNRLPWDLDDPDWHGVLMHPNGRIMQGSTNANFAAPFIAYLAGCELSIDERERLIDHIAGDDPDYRLPLRRLSPLS